MEASLRTFVVGEWLQRGFPGKALAAALGDYDTILDLYYELFGESRDSPYLSLTVNP